MKIQHVGRYDKRRKDGSPSGDREDAFVRTWQKANDEVAGINSGAGILQHLLHAKPIQDCAWGETRFDAVVTQDEATNAATLIQWLGTNCGWDFLRLALKACGYKVIESREDKP